MKVHALSVYMRRKESVDSQIRGSVIPSFRECYGRSVCVYVSWRGQAFVAYPYQGAMRRPVIRDKRGEILTPTSFLFP